MDGCVDGADVVRVLSGLVDFVGVGVLEGWLFEWFTSWLLLWFGVCVVDAVEAVVMLSLTFMKPVLYLNR